ncbi:hypothetical protein [Streptantibioticus ferralitis]|uniref:hypothetical protein n=1 Tax=Streptantibioticus ferralitis TaxID=236510 RepID=UPI0027E34137|nr:hypothetical protein [Streptantibioticus ferralitis]
MSWRARTGTPSGSVSENVTEERLLLSLLEREGTKAAFVPSALGVTERREPPERALGEARRRGGISR